MLGAKLKKMDHFGSSLRLNFRGEESFKTKRGGLITLGTYVLAFILQLELLTQLWTQEDPEIS